MVLLFKHFCDNFYGCLWRCLDTGIPGNNHGKDLFSLSSINICLDSTLPLVLCSYWSPGRWRRFNIIFAFFYWGFNIPKKYLFFICLFNFWRQPGLFQAWKKFKQIFIFSPIWGGHGDQVQCHVRNLLRLATAPAETTATTA